MNSAMFVDKDGMMSIMIVILDKQLQVQKGQELGKKILQEGVESKQEGEMMRREEDDNSDKSDKHGDGSNLSVRIKGWLSFTVQKNNSAEWRIF
jgi:hypothetical protein